MERLRVVFNSFGGRDAASARLRAWAIADELRLIGHEPSVHTYQPPERGPGPDVIGNIEVFQKVRPHDRLAFCRRRSSLTVFDIDDHYLLDEVGTRSDVLRFMNLVDVVTVGSRHLLDIVSEYHDDVSLFENPLDVLPGSEPRGPQGWRGRIGWFGNRTSLSALEDLDLSVGVTTITAGGEVPWSVDSVDATVAQLDLLLIPVRITEWTVAKNANRLLKCVALGVPFLASRTVEHETAVRDLALPEWLLIDEPADWNDAIERVRDEYHAVTAQLSQARARALDRYGIRPVSSAWIQGMHHRLRDREAIVGHLQQPSITAQPNARFTTLEAVDVVVLNENDPDFGTATLASLRLDEMPFRSVTLISASARVADAEDGTQVHDRVAIYDEHDDFFEIYGHMKRVLGQLGGEHALLLRGGARACRGLFSEIARCADGPGVHLFRSQLATPQGELLDPSPVTLDELLARPYRPHAMMMPTRLAKDAGGLNASILSLGLWDLLIRLYQLPDVNAVEHEGPWVLIDPRAERRHAIQSYSVWLAGHEEELLADLPSHDAEWRRLSYVLHSAVAERHQAVLADRMSSLTPAFLDRIAQLEHQVEHNDRALRTARKEIASLKQRHADRRSDRQEFSSALEVTVKPAPRIIRTPARLLWRTTSLVLPQRTRIALYRRFRRRYASLYSERASVAQKL